MTAPTRPVRVAQYFGERVIFLREYVDHMKEAGHDIVAEFEEQGSKVLVVGTEKEMLHATTG